MKENCATFGTLALQPYYEHDCEVVQFDRRPYDGVPEKTEVEQILDDFEGAPFAETASDRRFAGIALAVAGAAMLFFSFAPIF